MSNRVSGISDMDVQQAMGLSGAGMRGRYMPGMFAQGQDRFTGSQQQPQQEFSIWRAAGKFFQGAVVDTITGLFSVKGVAMMVGAGLVCAAGGAPLVLAAGLGLGGFQLLKGAFGAASNYASGNYAEAEESFRDIGGGTVAVAGAAVGLRARYASAEGVGGKMGALWGDLSGKSQYNFMSSAGTPTTGNMYQMMGSRAKTGFNTVYEIFRPSAGSVGKDSTIWGRLKNLFVAEESVAGARVAAKEAHVLAKEQAALTADSELVTTAFQNKARLPGGAAITSEAEALAAIQKMTPQQFGTLKTRLGLLAEAEAFAADGALVAEAAKLRPGLDAATIKAMTPGQFAALQAEMSHANKLAQLAAAKPDSALRLAAERLFPKRDFSANPLNAGEMAQLEAGAGLLEAAGTRVTAFKGVAANVPAELVESLQTVRPGITAAEIAAMNTEQLAIAMADQQIAAQAANTPGFFARITNSDAWRNTLGRVDGAPKEFVIGDKVFVNSGSGFATPGVRRIAGATAGNVFRED